MNIRAAVFDIDGTLLPFGAACPSAETGRALRALSESGAAVIVATGRARYMAEHALGGVVCPDYFAAANGCDVTDAAGRTLWSSRMTPEEMYALVDFCEDRELPLEFIFSDAYHVYVEYEAFRRKYRLMDGNAPPRGMLRDGEDRTRHLQDMPFSACAALQAQDAEQFGKRYPHLGLRFLPFAPGLYDILRADADKTVGVARLLERLGIPWEQTAAFGDGENDAWLLREAGFSVAMEDGAPALRELADVIAPPAAQDGVARVVWEYLLPEKRPCGASPHAG